MDKIFYTNETICNENGISCRVLDLEKISFVDSVLGRKSSITKIECAKGDEVIITYNIDGKIESTYNAQKGDAIFYNSEKDKYVPRDASGKAWEYAKIESYGYTIVEKGKDCLKVKSKNTAQLLVGIIKEPSCIKDAWGAGAHQFLFKCATLKKDVTTGKITGIDENAFKNTWEVLNNKKSNNTMICEK